MLRQKGIKSEPVKESAVNRFKNKMKKKRTESGPDTPIRMPSGGSQDKIDVGYLL